MRCLTRRPGRSRMAAAATDALGRHSSPESPVIEIENLTKRFGDRTVLDDISLTLGSGEILAVVGPQRGRQPQDR